MNRMHQPTAARWIRIVAVAIAALVLASCRSLAPPAARQHCPPEAATCPPALPVCPPPPPIPVVGPYLVCDGGDHAAPAKAVGAAGLANLTAGDTVARFQPADDGPEADRVEVVASNCACVYAPRFSAVRQVSRLVEESLPQGPVGLVNEQLVGLEVERQPVWGSVQNRGPEAARTALPGVAGGPGRHAA